MKNVVVACVFLCTDAYVPGGSFCMFAESISVYLSPQRESVRAVEMKTLSEPDQVNL